MARKSQAAKPGARDRECGGCVYARVLPVDGLCRCFALPPQVAVLPFVGTEYHRSVVGKNDPACSLWEPDNAAQTPDSPSGPPE